MTTRDYEAMFLLDNTQVGEDFDGAAARVDEILQKHGAEIVLKEKWDERKLAYEIKGHRRATYYLVYFRAPTRAIAEIDGDVRLNELVLRHLVMALDEPIEEHVEKRKQERERLAEETRKSSMSSWGGKKGGPSRRDSRGEGRSDYDDDDDRDSAPRPKRRPAPAGESSGSSE